MLKRFLDTILSDPEALQQQAVIQPVVHQPTRPANPKRLAFIPLPETGHLGECVQQSYPFINQILDAVDQEGLSRTRHYPKSRMRQIVSKMPLLKATPKERIALVIALTHWGTSRFSHLDYNDINILNGSYYYRAAQVIIDRLLQQPLPFTAEDLALLLQIRNNYAVYVKSLYSDYPLNALLKKVEKTAEANGLTDELREELSKLKSFFRNNRASHRLLLQQVMQLLGESPLEKIEKGEMWSDMMLADLEKMPRKEKYAWEAIFVRSMAVNSSKPSKKWIKETQESMEQIGHEEFIAQARAWFSLVSGKPERTMPTYSSEALKGLVWACLNINDSELAHAVGDLAIGCYEKARNYGPRSERVGNACLYTLSWMASDDAVSQLSRIKPRVKTANLRRRVAKALNEAAQRRGMSVEQLEEIAVPKLGLDKEMCYPERPGGYTARFAYRPGGRIRVDWHAKNGSKLKSTPGAVRREHTETLEHIRQIQKVANGIFSAQRARLDSFFILDRSWEYQIWRERYLDHPLIGLLVRLLIWHFQQGEQCAQAIWQNGQLAGLNGAPLEWIEPETRVSLWHPLGFEVETVVAWRIYLEEHQITQPFKQAHREIYLLTDAELETHTYSNRFAAHILRQIPFLALTRQRGWKYSMSSYNWDSQNTATLEIPQTNLKAQFWVQPIQDTEFGEGVYQSISTDQVRFVNMDGQAIPLPEIPVRVFSEVMRDVDLFVGVNSVGADPTWQDHGERPERLRNYWQSFSFGDLSTTANTRREVMERLLPRLKIADRSHLTDKFLVVKGELRTYKIHLGSGNILMEPNDQYLCIVPGRTESDPNLFLPFEGDSTLSVILSKAFLLADDRKIKDPTITRQINRN